MEYVIGWFVLSLVVAAVSSSRRLGFFGGLFLSLLLSPLIGLIIAAFSPRRDGYSQGAAPQRQPEASADELVKWKRLYEMGEITAEEYDRKKRQIIG